MSLLQLRAASSSSEFIAHKARRLVGSQLIFSMLVAKNLTKEYQSGAHALAV